MTPDFLFRNRDDEVRYLTRRQRVNYYRLARAEEEAKNQGTGIDSHSGRYIASWVMAVSDLLARRGTLGPAAAEFQVRRDVEDAAEDDERLEAAVRKRAEEQAQRDAQRTRATLDRLVEEDCVATAAIRKRGIGVSNSETRLQGGGP